MYANVYIHNIERWYLRSHMQGSSGETDIENRPMDMERGEERLSYVERVTWTLTSQYIK